MALTQISTEGIKNGTISSADLAADAVTGAKIADDAVDNEHLAANSVRSEQIMNNKVTLAKLPLGTSSSDGKFLRANNGGQPTFETVNTDLVSDTSPQLGGDLDVNGKKIKFPDLTGSVNNILYFGTGDDLLIYHHADVNYIQCENARTLRIQHFSGGNETLANFIPNGAVELYYDNSKKFETTSTGAAVHHSNFCTLEIRANTQDAVLRLTSHNNDNTDWAIQNDQSESNILDFRFNNTSKMHLTSDGSLHLVGNLDLEDNDKLKLGAGDDLQIYHDGTRNLLINNNCDLFVAVTSSGETSAVFKTNGAVELYYNNSKKFETRDAGATLFGDFYMGDDRKIRLGDATGGDLRLYHDGSNSYITHGSTGNLRYQSNNHDFYNQAGNEFMCRMFNDGSVRLYHNGSEKFETTSSGVNVTGAITVNGSALTTATNSPAFSVKLSSTTNRNGEGTVVFDSEHLDTDSCYNTSNGRFTPDVAGNYMLTFTFVMNGSSSGIIAGAFGAIRKNGSTIIARFWTDPMQSNNNQLNRASCSGSAIVPMNGSSDFIEIRAYGLTTTGGNVRISDDGSNFSGFKLA